MTDTRKLLDMAAKACGVNTYTICDCQYINHEAYADAMHDDGDCARMRTKLRINVLWSDTAVHCANQFGDAYESFADHELPDAALRMCALRVAAMMGEQM